MITCPKCNKELEDGTRFCEDCGAEIFETVFCPNCGTQTSTEFAFCQSCGAAMTQQPAQPQEESQPEDKKKLPIKPILFGAIGVAAIAVVVLLVSLLFGGKAQDNYTLYIKDQELTYSNMKKNSDGVEVSSKLLDMSEISNESVRSYGPRVEFATVVSNDGKYIFFPDKIDETGSYTLYFKKMSKLKDKAVKVDSNISSYELNDSVTTLTYKKDGNLYQYNIKKEEKDKIASEVASYWLSEDGSKILYTNQEGNLYLKDGKKDKEKIASEVSSVEVSDDFKTVYYLKEGSLYKQVLGKDKEKIASDVNRIVITYESGELYYIRKESQNTSLMDYVEDDMKEADEKLTEPKYPDYPKSPDYPSWWDYDTDEEYNAAYEAYKTAYAKYEEDYKRMQDEYNAAMEAYYAKNSRDYTREELKNATMERSAYSLCFFDGKEETVLSKSVTSDYPEEYAYDAPVVIYTAYNQSEVKKVKLSEIENVYELQSQVEEALFSSSDTYVATKAAATLIEPEKEISHIRMNNAGTDIYYIDNVDEGKNYGDLYHISVNKGNVEQPEVYDTDVYTGNISFINGTDLEYFKDYKDDHGELYINKEPVDSDVYVYSGMVFEYSDKYLYFTDWNSEKSCGTLKVYENSKVEEIAEDVYEYDLTPGDRILYLTDFSQKNLKGDLYQWNNGKTWKIDEDVAYLIHSFNRNVGIGAFMYGW